MINIALIDDIESEQKKMEEILALFEQENSLSFSISCFTDGKTFLGSFQKYSYSIIFMDIFMDGISGIDTALTIRQKDPGCIIIFLTESGEHMPEAFSCHAFEYIQKPASKERIFPVLSDALRLLPQESRFIEFSYSRQSIKLLLSNIVCITARGHYTDITDNRGKVYSPRTGFTKFIAPLQDDRRFLSINKGIFVNMDYIIRFENNCCKLAGDITFPVRIRERTLLEQKWQDYNFSQIHADLIGSKPQKIY